MGAGIAMDTDEMLCPFCGARMRTMTLQSHTDLICICGGTYCMDQGAAFMPAYGHPYPFGG